jgi:hypothetical protein
MGSVEDGFHRKPEDLTERHPGGFDSRRLHRRKQKRPYRN